MKHYLYCYQELSLTQRHPTKLHACYICRDFFLKSQTICGPREAKANYVSHPGHSWAQQYIPNNFIQSPNSLSGEGCRESGIFAALMFLEKGYWESLQSDITSR